MHFRSLLSRFRTPSTLHVSILAIVGLLLVFLVPPFQSPDEQTHLYRAYQISEGHIFAKRLSYGAGDTLPKSLSESFNAYYYLLFQPDKKVDGDVLASSLRMPLDTYKEVETRFENTAIYPPAAYIPQAFGIGLGRVFSASPVVLLYLARLMNLAAWLALIWLCMKRNPRLVLPLFAFALLPIVAFQASSASADVVTAGIAIAFTLEVFRLVTQKVSVRSNKDLYVLGGLGLALALCKFPYAFLALLVFIIPNNSWKTVRDAWTAKAILSAIALLPALLWFAISQRQFVNLRQEADSAVQLQGILTDPLSYVGVLYNTYVSLPSDGLYIQMIGQLGWLDTKLPFWLLLFGALSVLLAVLCMPISAKVRELSRLQKIITATVGLMLVGLVSTALYLTWNAPGAGVIEGLQGRYYMPLFGVVIMLLGGLIGLTQAQHNRASRVVYALSGLTITATLVILLLRYYNF